MSVYQGKSPQKTKNLITCTSDALIGKLLSLPPLALLPWDEHSSCGNKDGDYYVFLSWKMKWFVLSDRDTLDTDSVQYVLRWA